MDTKIALIGTIIDDVIHGYDGTVKESLGGIFYNLSIFSAIVDVNTTIFPICNVGYNIWERVREELVRFPNVSSKGLKKVRQRNNRVNLKYFHRERRVEILKNLVPRIHFDQVLPFLDSDIILINFISGFELSIDDLETIRSTCKSTIYMDIHSLTLGIDEQGKRVPRKLWNWERWVSCADIIQLNENELSVI
ncbi:MAG: hypothetical protein ACE5QV_04670, partial [Fidelibacterota bacterium]